jgi:hypothetical protein
MTTTNRRTSEVTSTSTPPKTWTSRSKLGQPSQATSWLSHIRAHIMGRWFTGFYFFASRIFNGVVDVWEEIRNGMQQASFRVDFTALFYQNCYRLVANEISYNWRADVWETMRLRCLTERIKCVRDQNPVDTGLSSNGFLQAQTRNALRLEYGRVSTACILYNVKSHSCSGWISWTPFGWVSGCPWGHREIVTCVHLWIAMILQT